MNPEGQMRLCDSVKLFGLCTDMCPEYERVRRIVEEDVKPPECVGAASFPRLAETDLCRHQRRSISPGSSAYRTRREWSRHTLGPQQAWTLSWFQRLDRLLPVL
jgi:hypothetical protein